jgi:hypothetical protein
VFSGAGCLGGGEKIFENLAVSTSPLAFSQTEPYANWGLIAEVYANRAMIAETRANLCPSTRTPRVDGARLG